MSQKSWRDNIKLGQEVATFKETNRLTLKFHDDGVEDKTKIGGKDVSTVKFVVDIQEPKRLAKEKVIFSPVSKRLIVMLAEVGSLTGKVLEIHKIGQGTGTTWEIEEIKSKK